MEFQKSGKPGKVSDLILQLVKSINTLQMLRANFAFPTALHIMACHNGILRGTCMSNYTFSLMIILSNSFCRIDISIKLLTIVWG